MSVVVVLVLRLLFCGVVSLGIRILCLRCFLYWWFCFLCCGFVNYLRLLVLWFGFILFLGCARRLGFAVDVAVGPSLVVGCLF